MVSFLGYYGINDITFRQHTHHILQLQLLTLNEKRAPFDYSSWTSVSQPLKKQNVFSV